MSLSRRILVFAVVLLTPVVALTVVKACSRNSGSDELTRAPPAPERERTTRFWQLYRDATNDRTAGRTAAAADGYAQALALNGAHEDALYYLGSMQLELGRFSAAESTWQRLLALNPSSSRAHASLGVLYSCPEATGRFDPVAAAAQFERALEINANQTGPLLGLAEIALMRGDPATASRHLDRVLSTNGSSVEAWFLKGYVAWSRGDVEQASTSFAEAVRHARAAKMAAAAADDADRTRAVSTPGPPKACRTLRPYTEDLSDLADDEVPAQVASRYGRFHRLLEGVDTLTVRAPGP